VTLKRNAAILIAGLATAGALAGCDCSPKTVNHADANPEYGASIVEAHLSTGPYLDCATDRGSYDRNTLNCDWGNPRSASDPSRINIGTFTVYQKHLTDGRVIDCIATASGGGGSDVDCDWIHAKHATA
jgi:hypothetical protein